MPRPSFTFTASQFTTLAVSFHSEGGISVMEASLTRSTLMKGWTTVVPEQPGPCRTMARPSKEQMIEMTEDLADLSRNLRAFRKRYERLRAAGDVEAMRAMRPEARELSGLVTYATRAWFRMNPRNQCPMYWEVPGGAIHTALHCRTINDHTRVEAVPKLVGIPLVQVIGFGMSVCRFCRNLTPEAFQQKVYAQTADWVTYLSAV